MTCVNDVILNHIYQNYINDVRKKADITNRWEKRTKVPSELANVASLLSFLIELAQLEDKLRCNMEILQKVQLKKSN